MDSYYGIITWIVIIATVIRIPALRRPSARPAWLATAAAAVALLSRGPFWSIQDLDGALGGSNLIFLVQCWFAALAFWFMSEAVSIEPDKAPRIAHRLWIPLFWCALFTVPFFFISDRSPTVLFFIDVHAEDPAAILCGLLYIGGIITIAVQLIWKLRRRENRAHWFFRIGAAMIAAGGTLWAVAIVIQPVFSLPRAQIEWMYLGFDDLFYPGVLIMAVGMIFFASQRSLRRRAMRRHIRDVEGMLHRRGIVPVTDAATGPDIVRDLVVQVEDLKAFEGMTLTAHEERTLSRVAAWLERAFPQLPRPLYSSGWSGAASSH